MNARLLVLILSVPLLGQAATYEISPSDDWFSRLHGGGLKPGDEVVLASGVYSDARRLEMRHVGTKEKPITIRAADGAVPVFRRPDARQNSINMAGCRFVVLRGIEITGGDAAIRIYSDGDRQSGFLLFEKLHIHHIAGVGITANNEGCVYEKLVFRGNEIHHTGGHGEAFYLGANNDAKGNTPGYMFDSLVEGNYIHHLNGPEISQGDGIEIKDGSYGNTVRNNIIHDTKCPGITIYGTDGKAANTIEGNVIWNTADNGIQAAADAVIRSNTIFDPGGDGIHCRSHQSAVPGNLVIEGNTIVRKGGSGIRVIKPEDEPFSDPIRIEKNRLFGGAALRIPSGDPFVEAKDNTSTGDVPDGYPEAWIRRYQPKPTGK